jgi:UDP-2-acetamido-3-amino-2,3-dideoxy-glucuronate N-acetyltransferase
MTTPDYFVHESAYVDEGARIGKGTKIWHFSHVLAGAEIGENVSIGQNVNVGGKARIGNRCKIQNNVSVYDMVEIEDDVFCGPSMVFTNVFNPRAFIVRKHEYRRTLVRRGATIGANATIVCGTTVGRYAFIAAGAVVTASPETRRSARRAAKSTCWRREPCGRWDRNHKCQMINAEWSSGFTLGHLTLGVEHSAYRAINTNRRRIHGRSPAGPRGAVPEDPRRSARGD